MELTVFSILLAVIGLVIGVVLSFIAQSIKNKNALNKADKLIENAQKEAEKIKRDNILEIKEESFKLKQETEKEIKEKKQELTDLNERFLNREKSLDKRDELLTTREKTLDERDNNLLAKNKEIQEKEAKMESLLKEQMKMLEEISGFSKEKAKKIIMDRVEQDMSREIAEYIKERESEAKLIADKKAKTYLISSMQRYSNDVASEQTVSTVTLPNDEMKGRIIGREGRNIRTIEAITGVDLIIDDTPEVIALSSFDPLRREMARVTLEGLIKDGRIHPSRIEELYSKTCEDFKAIIREKGEEALFELGITKVDPELVELIGKLNFRTSYGQNVLKHSIEVAALSGTLAAELEKMLRLLKEQVYFTI